MQLIPLHTTHPLYADAEQLIISAFPPEERRPTDKQKDATDHNPSFHSYAVTLDGQFAGLLNLWTLDGFDYVEHLATLPEMRGHGLGKRSTTCSLPTPPNSPPSHSFSWSTEIWTKIKTSTGYAGKYMAKYMEHPTFFCNFTAENTNTITLKGKNVRHYEQTH